ncbi:MAG: hypothetical protein ACRC6M_16750 [Microcystaceae cyanobacterium]
MQFKCATAYLMLCGRSFSEDAIATYPNAGINNFLTKISLTLNPFLTHFQVQD